MLEKKINKKMKKEKKKTVKNNAADPWTRLIYRISRQAFLVHISEQVIAVD